MKFDGSFLDFRDENGIAGCVVVLMSAIEKRDKRENKKSKEKQRG